MSSKKAVPLVLALSVAGIVFIQKYEGTSLNAYLDVVQVPTICTGSTRNVFVGQKATLAECEERLREDTTYAGIAVQRYVLQKLSQGQYDALVSFVFNVGPSAFKNSTLLRKLNAGECHAAAREFLRWNKAKGKVYSGLTKRRAAEKEMFEKDCDD